MHDAAPTPPDAELIAAVRRGDPAAADRLVKRHFRAAFAVALALLGNAMDAEDTCQDAFVRALERIDDCRNPERFVYWLLSIVRNRARNLRDHRRVRSGPAFEEESHASPDRTGRAVEDEELARRLTAALATLTPEQREAVLLKDLEGWDHAAIARTMEISEVMSRQHVFTARRALRERLGSRMMEEYRNER